MRSAFRLYTVSIGLLLFISSCKTYYITVDSFKQQFAGLDSSNLKEVTTRGPAGDKVKYMTYPIDYINCVDKDNKPVELKNGPAIEIRFTDNRNKKTIFYFDRIRVTDSSVSGSISRFIGSWTKTIPLASIEKIEVQNGGKNFKYVQ